MSVAKVFIIATGPDVRTVREMIKRQLVQEGFEIVELLRFGEHAKSSDERQESAIAECDAVLNLIGHCFGPKPAQFDLKQRRRSYGEIEQELAQRLGKPIFTLVCAPQYFFDQHEPEAGSLQRFHQERRDRIVKGGIPHIVVKMRKELLAKVADFENAVRSRQYGTGWQTEEFEWTVQKVEAPAVHEPEPDEPADAEAPAAPGISPAHPAAPIEFALFGPENLARGSEGRLEAWSFVENQRALMESCALGRATAPAADESESGIDLEFRLTIPSLHIYADRAAARWEGLPVAASWTIRVPTLVQGAEHPGRIEVRALGARVAWLNLQISLAGVWNRLTQDSGERGEWPTEIERPQTAFVSYASEERAYLDPVLRPLRPLWPQLDLFLDADALREQDDWWEQTSQRIPGSDLFFLAWSSVADASEHVHQELALALEGKGNPEIVPFPIENAELAPPPATLSAETFASAFRLVVAAQEWTEPESSD